MRADIVVRDATGKPILAVEVKARRGVNQAWAAELRRNLHAHGTRLATEYFMIVTTDETYLWREPDHAPTAADPPDAVVATADLIGERPAVDQFVDGRALELLASSWLSAVAAADSRAQLRESSQEFVVGTGLYDALHGAAVAFEPV